MRNITEIIVHHSAVEQQDMNKLLRSFNRTHERLAKLGQPEGHKSFPNIAYHAIITDEEVKYVRPFGVMGFHASNLSVNAHSIGICLAGNFDNRKPSVNQLFLLLTLIERIKRDYPITKISGHRDYSSKSCPGKMFTDDMFLINKNKTKMNKTGIKFNSKAFNRDDEQVINNVSRYLMDRVAPKLADLKNDQQIDLNDSSLIDKTPAMAEYVKAFGVFFPQVVSLLHYKDEGFVNDVKWGWLETMTQFLPAIRVGVDNDKINLSDPVMVVFANLIYKKGKQVATGTLEIRDENKEAGQK